MKILELNSLVKQYKNHLAVDKVSFDLEEGKIFGLLGPNGAGKTSIIRMITHITMPDEGDILFAGEPLRRKHVEQIGYLPEERGLYKKMKVGEQILYLAQLKGMSKAEAKARVRNQLAAFEMESWWDKKIEELSKGMQQKVQYVATIIHNPRLLILDEPFTGLDPINTKLIKTEIKKRVEQGTTVIFSTHRMEQVEEICEDIALINRGRNVLKGEVDEIKNNFKKNIYRVGLTDQHPNDLSDPNLTVTYEGNDMLIQAHEDMKPNQILKALIDDGVEVYSFEEVRPSLNDIFIEIVEEQS